MRALSVLTGGKANSGLESPCRKSGKTFPANSAVMRVAQALWPRKTDLELAARTAASDRMCRYWLCERYSLSADDLAALLRSDDGMKFLEAIMGDAKPVWWRRVKKSSQRAALRKAQHELQAQIDQMELELDQE